MSQGSQETLAAAGRENHQDQVLIHGMAWTGAIKWASQVVSWASTLLVARFLAPEDYGLIGMAMTYLGLVALINEFGLGTVVVTLHQLSRNQLAQINALSLVVGTFGFFASIVAAGPIAEFYRAPRLRWIIIAMSLSFLVTAFKTVPYALLQKDLKFKTIAVVEGTQALLQSGTTVLFAWMGYHYWAIVLGGVSGAMLSTLAVVAIRSHGFAWPTMESLGRVFTFCGHIMVGRLSWFVYSNADFVIAGKVLGEALLGVYTLAWYLANMPIDKISALVIQVTPAFFANLKSDGTALRRYLTKLTEGLAFVTFPIAFGVALVAEDLVAVVLGGKWSGVAMPLRLLALSATFRSITPLFAVALNAIEETRITMYSGLAAAVLLPIGFYFGSSWGTTGIAMVWLIGLPIFSLPAYWRLVSCVGLSLRQYLAALWPTVSACLVMILAVLAVKLQFGALGFHLKLALEVLSGAAAYALTFYAFHSDRLRTYLQVYRSRLPS